ncbi:DUF1275 family protein [Dactylosporangium sp. NPDC049525]|uniref:DUF1275 family protein n=1 Tax=Dactylosporangium sp. NPDC049525 TaxID=3154730 RepID=UPI003433B02A
MTGVALSERTVRWLLLALAAAAGCLDAVCVSRLGGVFASVVTGNLVQLGRAAATADGWAAAGAAVAVASYAAGVAAGTTGLRSQTTKPRAQTTEPHHPVAGPHQPAAGPHHQTTEPRQPAAAGWWRRTTMVAAGETALLAGVAVGWQATGARPGHAATLLLLCAAAAAMGVQSAVTLGSGVAGASTTYLTGTLTSMVRHAITGPHAVTGTGGAARLGALLCGAAAGAGVLRVAPLWAPTLAAALVAAAVATALVAGARFNSGPRA